MFQNQSNFARLTSMQNRQQGDHQFTFRNRPQANIEQTNPPLSDKFHQLNKMNLPLTEYSNKFLRNTKTVHAQLDQKMISKHRKIIVIKQKLRSLQQKENNLVLAPQDFTSVRIQQSHFLPTAPIKLSKLKTEEPHAIESEQTVNQTSFLSSLQLKRPKINSCLLGTLSNALVRSNRQSFHRKTERYEQDKEEKISQSRGLERFSKLYIRNRFQMLEKVKKRVSFSQSNPQKMKDNNFEVHKITPIEKTKKRSFLSQRSPLKQQKAKNLFHGNRQARSPVFSELNGWQTFL